MSDDALYFADSGAPQVADALDMFQRPEWHAQAACRGMGSEVFFPERGDKVSEAIAICEGCPVRQECLEFSLQNGERNGIWGGVPERRRRNLRAEWRANKTGVVPKPGELDNCGTDSGYYSHRYRNQPACPACLAAHAEAARKYLVQSNNARRFRHQVRREAGWCAPCVSFKHADCKKSDCRCTRCHGNDLAQLPVDHAVKDHLEEDLSPTSEAGVENGKGGPLGDHLREAG